MHEAAMHVPSKRAAEEFGRLDILVNNAAVRREVPFASSKGEPAHQKHHAPPVGRRSTPKEVAALVRFLCGPRAHCLTGQTIHANGGLFLP